MNIDETKRGFGAWCKRLWWERRPLVFAVAVLAAGLPLVIFLAQSAERADAPALDAARKAAQAATAKGEYVRAYERLKQNTAQARTKDQKIALYSDLAAAAANTGKPIEALDYLGLKHQLDPNSAKADAYMLATLYEAKGDKQRAIEQYKVAIGYYSSLPSDPANDAHVESLQAIIDELEGSEQ